MPGTVLVTEGDSPLGEALARLLTARGLSVVKIVSAHNTQDTAAAPGPASPGGGGPAARQSTVPWNRRSPLSARTVLLNVVNMFDAVDEVLILEPPCGTHPTLHDMSSVEIEKAFDDAKGPVFMAREALAHFLGRHGGVLCMVSTGAGSSPLENGMRECFRGLSSTLLAAGAENTGIVINGFQPGGAQPEEYAAFIDKTLEEKARKLTGRWFTCPSRTGFLKGMKSKKA